MQADDAEEPLTAGGQQAYWTEVKKPRSLPRDGRLRECKQLMKALVRAMVEPRNDSPTACAVGETAASRPSATVFNRYSQLFGIAASRIKNQARRRAQNREVQVAGSSGRGRCAEGPDVRRVVEAL